MATKLSTDDAGKHFSTAQNYFTAAKLDQQDPASVNLLAGIYEFFYAVGANQTQLVAGMNELLQRVEKIEQALASRRP